MLIFHVQCIMGIQGRHREHKHQPQGAALDSGVCGANRVGTWKISELYASALVLEDGTGQKFVIASSDSIAVTRELKRFTV
jgi:hypothetical protein